MANIGVDGIVMASSTVGNVGEGTSITVLINGINVSNVLVHCLNPILLIGVFVLASLGVVEAMAIVGLIL